MSTQLKPYLKNIADKIRDNRENLYNGFILGGTDTTPVYKGEWTVMNYQNCTISKSSNGIKVVVNNDIYPSIFIKIGNATDFYERTLLASFDEIDGVNVQFAFMDVGYDKFNLGEKGTSLITTTVSLADIEGGTEGRFDSYWIGVGISFNATGTYNINNITIKDVSPINAQDYPTEIDNVHQSGVKDGKNEQYNEFWDNYIVNLISGAYASKAAFAGVGWNDKTFNPNKDLIAKFSFNCENFFAYSLIGDLKGILERNGVKFSTTGAVYFDSFAIQCHIKRFPELDMAKAQRLSQCFYGCTKLKSIDKIILSSTATQNFTSTFYGCSKLEEIRFEGVIRASVSFSSSPLLSYESLQSIISCLYDFVSNGNTSTHTLTLHADAKARLTQGDIAEANAKGWSVA